MQRHYLSLLLLVGLMLSACQSETPEVSGEATSPYDTYGATFNPEGAVPVQAVLAEVDQYAGQTVKIEGTVVEVCQAMGCWLTLQADMADPIRIHVAREEDDSYVFTVPKDLSGRHVVVHGTLETETISVEEQRHHAEDAGATEEELAAMNLQPKPELRLTASGVLVEKS